MLYLNRQKLIHTIIQKYTKYDLLLSSIQKQFNLVKQTNYLKRSQITQERKAIINLQLQRNKNPKIIL